MPQKTTQLLTILLLILLVSACQQAEQDPTSLEAKKPEAIICENQSAVDFYHCDLGRVYQNPLGNYCKQQDHQQISTKQMANCSDSFLLGIGEPIEWNRYNNGRDLPVEEQMANLMTFKPEVYRMWLWSELINPLYQKQDLTGESLQIKEKLIETEIKTYQENIRLLKNEGVIVVGMDHLFMSFMTGLSKDLVIPRLGTYRYASFLKSYEQAWRELALLFREIDYWEPGNEFNYDLFLEPEEGEPFTVEEKAQIQVDLLERASKAIKSVDEHDFIFAPAFYPPEENYSLLRRDLRAFYDELNSRNLKPRDLYDGLALHPYWYSGECDPLENCKPEINEGNWQQELIKTFDLIEAREGQKIPIYFSELGFQDLENSAEWLENAYQILQSPQFISLWGWSYFRLTDDASDPSGGAEYGLMTAPESDEGTRIKEVGEQLQEIINTKS
jgi:hypothetical protein